MPSVYVKTLGCKVNTFDGHALENQFRARGFDLATAAEDADVTVVNTCSVTANADREARYLARRLRRENPKSLLVFTGCYAQTDSARLVAMPEIDFVVPNAAKDTLAQLVTDRLASPSATSVAGEAETKLPEGHRPVRDNRQSHFKSAVTLFDRADSSQTRTFVKIQDGCDGFCAYCLIPYARGASRSVPQALVLGEVERLLELGAGEIVLTGIHIGDYGRDLPESAGMARPIVPLVREILSRLASAPHRSRLRISSLEPAELSEELVETLAEFRDFVCDHFHLPLQSGSDRILKPMRRTYDRAGYARAVALVREKFPEANIGADVIPGFPGETAADAADTVAFVRDLGLAYLHVFPYSSRPNTAASRMPGHLAGDLVKARAAELRELSTELATAYARPFIGRTVAVLWERDVDDQGRRLGYTANYLRVAAATAPGDAQPPPGATTTVRLKGFLADGRLLGLASSLHGTANASLVVDAR